MRRLGPPRFLWARGMSEKALQLVIFLVFFLSLWVARVIFFFDELAGYIKMSRTKLYGMAQRGEVSASKIGNQWRLDREGIDQRMKAHATGEIGFDNKDKKQ